MARLQHLARVTAHAAVFSVTIHVWHVITCEHMVGAYADVTVDHIAHFAERALMEGKR